MCIDNKIIMFFRKDFFWRSLFLLVILFSTGSCGWVTDSIRNWGITTRQDKAKEIEEVQLKQWERDLNLSRTRVNELRQNISDLIQESNRQGHLSWKIAKAFCESERYEEGIDHIHDALENRPTGESKKEELNIYEKSLPYFQRALKKHKIEANLLFDAGLCYANASKTLGWERNRFETAVYLFERMQALAPNDSRASYQLAILFGKTIDEDLRDRNRAIQLLNEVINKDENDIASRFALANIYVEDGKMEQAVEEYRIIQSKIEELHSRGTIPGSLKKNRQYNQAAKNIEELNYCINGDPQCSVLKF